MEKAGTIKPGIYNIHLSVYADQTQSHEGLIVHADKDTVFQQVGKSFIKHDREKFDSVPQIGEIKAISYVQGLVVVSPSSDKLLRRAPRR